MSSQPKTVLAIAAVAAALPVTTLAATPHGGATYVGSRGGTSSLLEKVFIKVAPSGRTATGTYFCRDTASPQSFPRFKIVDGRFEAIKKTGSFKVFGLKGRFVTRDRIEGTLDARHVCNAKIGKLTLLRKVA